MDIQKKVEKTIKKLHDRCDGNNNIEHLHILPSRWLYLLKFDNFGDTIHENFQNASCTPIQFFVEENLVSWHTKTHGPCNYLQNFYLAALIHKCGRKKYPYAEIRNFTAGRRIRSFQKENDNNGIFSSSSDDEFTPKYKKSYGENINTNFNAFMDRRCEELIEADNVMFKNRKIFPKFVLAPFRLFLYSKFDRLSLKQLECEMDSTGYTDDNNIFELGYCGHTQFPHSNIFLDQASDLILSQFQ